MTCKELIDKLEEFEPNMKVRFFNKNALYLPCDISNVEEHQPYGPFTQIFVNLEGEIVNLS
ncbi:MAG TPA: hypothetical protein VKR58_05840 [Aquella sp.]|nr:hypothetical protein [Aquella sp.]